METGRGGAAGAAWIVRGRVAAAGDAIVRGRVAAAPRVAAWIVRGRAAAGDATVRGGVAAPRVAAWIVRREPRATQDLHTLSPTLAGSVDDARVRARVQASS